MNKGTYRVGTVKHSSKASLRKHLTKKRDAEQLAILEGVRRIEELACGKVKGVTEAQFKRELRRRPVAIKSGKAKGLRTVSYRQGLLKQLREDPKLASIYLGQGLASDDKDLMRIAAMDVVDAFGLNCVVLDIASAREAHIVVEGFRWIEDGLRKTLDVPGHKRFADKLAVARKGIETKSGILSKP